MNMLQKRWPNVAEMPCYIQILPDIIIIFKLRLLVSEKTKACEIMLKEIAIATKIATEKKASAQEKEKDIIVFSREINVEKVGTLLPFLFLSFYSSLIGT